MFMDGDTAQRNAVMDTAQKMCAAARTAPHTCGIDHIVTAIVTDKEKDELAAKMNELAHQRDMAFFKLNAQNVLDSEAVVLIGTTYAPRGLKSCGFCGHGDCEGMKKSSGHCAYDDMDLGIALGSAVSIAADNRIDNRIMFSIGVAAMEMKILGADVGEILGIPLSTTKKNIYFDQR